MAEERLLTSAKIRLTLEVEWPHTFDENAKAVDIYTTAARECENLLRSALDACKVRYRIIGDIEPLMVVYPVKRP